MNVKPRVLVTGGTGLVGAPVVRLLAESGYDVTVLSRRRPPEKWWCQSVRWVCGDLIEPFQKTISEIGNVDYVVHVAAFIHDKADVRSLDALVSTNILASQELFYWCCEAEVKKVIYLSSLSVLRRPLTTPISECHAVGPASPYAMSKLWGEEQLFRTSQESCFTPIVLRISSPIPLRFEELPPTVVRHWIQAAQNGDTLRVFGTGRRSQDFVACSDIAKAVVQSIDSADAKGLYQIGSGTLLSMWDLAHQIAARRRCKVLLDGADPADGDKWELSLERAHRDFGYQPEFSGRAAIEMLLDRIL